MSQVGFRVRWIFLVGSKFATSNLNKASLQSSLLICCAVTEDDRGENGSDIIRPYPDSYSNFCGYGYADTDTDTDLIYAATDTDTVSNMETDTDNYPNPDILVIRISVLKAHYMSFN